MRVSVVIPARYASTRFPGKPLADLCGKPMIQWVYERSALCESVDRVIVATDDERIAEAVVGFGGEVVMTRADHPTGTDRLAEVAESLDTDLVVNVQGDEPLIDPAMIEAAVAPLLADPFFAEMAVSIMGGLTFATLLTLVAVPVFYRIALGGSVSRTEQPQDGSALRSADAGPAELAS